MTLDDGDPDPGMFTSLRATLASLTAAAASTSHVGGGSSGGGAVATAPSASAATAAATAVESLVDEVALELAELQRANRGAYARTRWAKAGTTEAKHDMDKLFLQLQNLSYERLHLRREVAKCRESESIYQNVDLLPFDEFVRVKSAAGVEAGTITAMGEHELMLARLQFEMDERKRLADELAAVRREKERLQCVLDDRNAALDRFDRDLDAFFALVRPLEDQLGSMVAAVHPAEGGGGPTSTETNGPAGEDAMVVDAP
ncbi:THO complex subunit 5 [Cladochytrium tenue]|nr:THO complex subunit 5 [Cladochytrium tenue]